MPFGMMSPLLAASDFWMAKWLTPFWFIGAGIVIGFAALAAFLLIFSLCLYSEAFEGMSPSFSLFD